MATIDNQIPVYGDTLTASLEDSNNTGTLTYTWYVNGVVAKSSTDKTYTTMGNDIAKAIKVVITSSVETGQVESAETAPVAKQTVQAPAAPTLASKTQTSIILNAISGYEYSIDGGVWQSSPIFNNLAEDTVYTFRQRVAETATAYASLPSPAVTFKTEVFVPNALTGAVTLDNTTPSYGDTLSASLDNSNNTGTLTYTWYSDAKELQRGASNTYKLVSSDIGHLIYVVITSSVQTGEVYSASTAPVAKQTVQAPAAPTLASKTQTSIVLNAISGYEYNRDGGIWQSSPIFNNLIADTVYTFRQRIAETETTYASTTSAALTIKTDSASVKPKPTPPSEPTVTPDPIQQSKFLLSLRLYDNETRESLSNNMLMINNKKHRSSHSGFVYVDSFEKGLYQLSIKLAGYADYTNTFLVDSNIVQDIYLTKLQTEEQLINEQVIPKGQLTQSGDKVWNILESKVPKAAIILRSEYAFNPELSIKDIKISKNISGFGIKEVTHINPNRIKVKFYLNKDIKADIKDIYIVLLPNGFKANIMLKEAGVINIISEKNKE